MTIDNQIRVNEIGPENCTQWNAFVAAAPPGRIYHTSFWMLAANRAIPGASFRILAARDVEGAIVAGYAALFRSRYGLWTEAVAPLLTPFAGLLLPPSATSRDTATGISETVRKNFATREAFSVPPGLADDDAEALRESGYRLIRRATFHVDLRNTGEELWSRVASHVRRHVRKSERDEAMRLIETEPTAAADWPPRLAPHADTAFALLADTFLRRGEANPVSRTWFDEIAVGEILAPYRHALGLVDQASGRLAAYVILLRFAGRVDYAIAATSHEALAGGASSRLAWRAMSSHAADAPRPAGCEPWHTFDFVGANIPSIARFKEGFAPEKLEYWRLERESGMAALAASAARFRTALLQIKKRRPRE